MRFRVRYQPHFITGGPPGCFGAANQSGYMNGENFYEFIQKFQQYTRCTPDNPILLLLDNHESHRTLAVLKFCRDNGIHLLSFPPHCSHRMQPLDVSVFGPFKNAANQLCADWVKMNPGRVMKHDDLSPVYKEALRIAATESNIVSGFAACGLYPLNRQIFTDIDFAPSETTDRPYTDDDLIMDDDLPMAEDNVVDEDISTPVNAQNMAQYNTIQYNTADFDFDFDMPTTSAAATSTPNTSMAGPSTTNTTTPNVRDDPYTTQELAQISETIAPYPKAPPRKTTSHRGRQPGKASILTSEQTFTEIEAQTNARDQKKAAVEARKKLAAEKRAAAQQKKTAIAEKKAATAAKKLAAAKKKNVAPKRLSQPRKTAKTPRYDDSFSSDDLSPAA